MNTDSLPLRLFIVGVLTATQASPALAEEAKGAPLRVAISGSYLPLHGPVDGEMAGLEVDLAAALARALGRELQILDRKTLGVGSVAAVASGKVDLSLSSITPTAARAKKVDFTRPYLQLRYRLAGGHEVRDLKKVKGLVAVPSGLVAKAVREHLGEARVVRMRTKAALRAFRRGEVDYLADESVGLLLAISGTRLKIVGPPFGSSSLAIAVPKGEASKYDALLTQVKETLDAIRRKWRPGDPAAARVGLRTAALGEQHTCAVDIDGKIVCWGLSSSGATKAPRGRFLQVAAGSSHSCGLREDKTVVCWGNINPTATPTGAFKAIFGGGITTCGLRVGGEAECWNTGKARADYDFDPTPKAGTFTRLSVGDRFACGLRPDATLACWGKEKRVVDAVPTGRFLQVSVGSTHACAVREDRTAVCWGNNARKQTDVLTGKYRQIEAGDGDSCAITTLGTLVCWGWDFKVGNRERPEAVGLTRLFSGTGMHYCGALQNGQIRCWGRDSDRVPRSFATKPFIGAKLFSRLPKEWIVLHEKGEALVRETYCDAAEASFSLSKKCSEGDHCLGAVYGQDGDAWELLSVVEDEGEYVFRTTHSEVHRLRFPARDEGPTPVGYWYTGDRGSTGGSYFVPRRHARKFKVIAAEDCER